MFYKENESHKVSEFENKELEGKEIKIYTWMDATLRELSDLLKDLIPNVKRKECVLEFYTIYFNYYGKFMKRNIGTIHAMEKGKDDFETLNSLNFHIGDLIDVCIKYSKKEAK